MAVHVEELNVVSIDVGMGYVGFNVAAHNVSVDVVGVDVGMVVVDFLLLNDEERGDLL